MKGPTEQVLDFVSQTNFQDLPPSITHEAKRLLLDSLGVGIPHWSRIKGDMRLISPGGSVDHPSPPCSAPISDSPAPTRPSPMAN